MTRLYLTATQHFSGEITATYDDAGELSVVDFSGAAGLTEKTKNWLMRNLPIVWLPAFLEVAKVWGFVAVAEAAEITFEQFWEAYGLKKNRVRTQKRWERLSKADRAAAYAGIWPYFRYLTSTGYQNKQHPDTYIYNRTWEDYLSPPKATKPAPVRTGEKSITEHLENYGTTTGKQQTEGGHRGAGK